MPGLADPGSVGGAAPGVKPITRAAKTIDGGEALLDALALTGIDFITSSPGSEWAPVWEAHTRRGLESVPAPDYVDVWHETVAVGLATGYSLFARRPSAVLLHAGAGLLQGASAIHGALLSGAPLLVLSAESSTYGEGDDGPDPGSQWYRNLSVVGGPHTLVSGFVKWAGHVASRATLAQTIVHAGQIAVRPPTGPVYLDIPLEVLLAPGDPVSGRPAAPPGRVASPAGRLEALAGLLLEARAPLIITESSGRDPEAYRALALLSERLAIPVIEPASAVVSNLSHASSMYLGPASADHLAAADLILLIDCRAPWYPPSNRPEGAKVVVIDRIPHRPHMAYQVLDADLHLEGDTAADLQGLLDVLDDHTLPGDEISARRARQDRFSAQLRDRRAAAAAATGASDAIHPVTLAARLAELAPAETTTFVDETITHSRIVREHAVDGSADGYLYVQGGLGQGIGVALGVKRAAPRRTVILTIGDGALLYNPVIPAISAAVDNGWPILVVVFNNRQYRSMKLNHLRFYPEGAAVRSGRFLGVDLSTQPDLGALAGSLGIHGETVSDPARLGDALSRALGAVAAGTPALLNVLVSE